MCPGYLKVRLGDSSQRSEKSKIARLAPFSAIIAIITIAIVIFAITTLIVAVFCCCSSCCCCHYYTYLSTDISLCACRCVLLYQSLYHVSVNFKKAFDRVWHAALWATMGLYNINGNLIRTIECLYNKATGAVYHDNNIGEWIRNTNGVRQGCLLSPTLFNIFLERIMADALEDHEVTVSIGDHKVTVSIGGRTITNLRFANDIAA